MKTWYPQNDFIYMYDGDKPIGRHPVKLFELMQKDNNFVKAYSYVQDVTRLVPDKAWLIYQFSKNLPLGCIAEVGVYHGGSARFFCDIMPDRIYYGWDTFKGIPPSNSELDDANIVGAYVDNIENVRKFIGYEDRVTLIPGVFPESFDVPEYCWEPIAFAHIDTDTYEGTMAGLIKLYPLVLRGGLMVIDDYESCFKGVTPAVKEFLADKPEKEMQLLMNQAFFFKV